MENKYHPYTEEAYIELKQIASTIKDYIPEDKASYVWNNFKLLSGDKSNQPCMCGSAAKYWGGAMNTIRDFITKVETNA
jgi:hypothetical protein|tara:strand:+ start:2702 stop:2938 length:237 start_codon:yes stop_codon:yes gene_type:complete